MGEEQKKKKKKITFFSDFKAFISRGNIIDLAIAVIIGGAFGKIVTSLVNDIIMPLISLMMGGLSVEDQKIILKHANEAKGTAELALTYGAFIQAIIDFLIIAFCIFVAIRIATKAESKIRELHRHNEHDKAEDVSAEAAQEQPTEQVVEAVPTPTKEEVLLTEIRDILKQQNKNE